MNGTARIRIASVVTLAFGLGAAAACSNPGAALGSDCLRDDDCMEGACVALRCRLAPTDPNARTAGGINTYTPPAADAEAPAAPDAGPAPAEDAATPAPEDADTTSDAGQ